MILKKCLLGLLLVVNSLVLNATDKIPSKAASKRGASTPPIISPYLKFADDIQRYAKKFIGTRYVYGGKAPKGFDCSGFVGYVFAKCGIKFDMRSSELAKVGYEICVPDALPGDLVFFRRSTNPRSPVSHVGIVVEYSTRGLKFIHATHGKGVTISYLPEKYYTNHFVGVRRVIDTFKNF
ncbi:MAG: C40 family peptidase [Spirosomaceae bacterium]|nr:C40 family peptidase [Spirosomataceae bacterium]